MNIHKLYKPFLKHFRTKRMRQFRRLFGLTTESSILDVGGSEFNWRLLPVSPNITILNLTVPRSASTLTRRKKGRKEERKKGRKKGRKEGTTSHGLLQTGGIFPSKMALLILFTATRS